VDAASISAGIRRLQLVHLLLRLRHVLDVFGQLALRFVADQRVSANCTRLYLRDVATMPSRRHQRAVGVGVGAQQEALDGVQHQREHRLLVAHEAVVDLQRHLLRAGAEFVVVANTRCCVVCTRRLGATPAPGMRSG
jgi:hypothetical protein